MTGFLREPSCIQLSARRSSGPRCALRIVPNPMLIAMLWLVWLSPSTVLRAEVPGVWYFNLADDKDRVRIVVGGTSSSPPKDLSDVHLAWGLYEQNRKDTDLMMPSEVVEVSSQWLLSSSPAVKQPLLWNGDDASVEHPRFLAGPGGELWVEEESTEWGWSQVLDALEAAWRQTSLDGAARMDLIEIGTFGRCKVISRAVPDLGDDMPDAWVPDRALSASSLGNEPYASRSTQAVAQGIGESVRFHQFQRWLVPNSGIGCVPSEDAEFRAFAARGEALLTLSSGIRGVDLSEVDPAGDWDPGRRALLSDAVRNGLASLSVDRKTIGENAKDLCSIAELSSACETRALRRAQAYVWSENPSSENLKELARLLAKNCSKALGTPCDLASPQGWGSSFAHYLTHSLGPVESGVVTETWTGDSSVAWELTALGDQLPGTVQLPGGHSLTLSTEGAQVSDSSTDQVQLLLLGAIGGLAALVCVVVIRKWIVRGEARESGPVGGGSDEVFPEGLRHGPPAVDARADPTIAVIGDCDEVISNEVGMDHKEEDEQSGSEDQNSLLQELEGLSSEVAEIDERLGGMERRLDELEKIIPTIDSYHAAKESVDSRLGLVEASMDRQLQVSPIAGAGGSSADAGPLARLLTDNPSLLATLKILAEQVPPEAIAALTDEGRTFASRQSLEREKKKITEVFNSLTQELEIAPSNLRVPVSASLEACSRLGYWIQYFWPALDASLDHGLKGVVDGLPAPARQEWLNARKRLTYFSLVEARLFRRLADGRADRTEPSIVEGNVLMSLQGQEAENFIERLRKYFCFAGDAGRFGALVTSLQYVLEAFTVEHLKKEERAKLHQRLRAAQEEAGLSLDVHQMLERLAEGIGLEYVPVRYYTNAEAPEYRKIIKDRMSAIDLSERIGFDVRTAHGTVVRLHQPFLFEKDTGMYLSGHVLVAAA